MAKVSLNYSEKQDEVEIKGSRIDENQFNLILSQFDSTYKSSMVLTLKHEELIDMIILLLRMGKTKSNSKIYRMGD